MELQLHVAQKSDIPQIKALFLHAFPPEERPPFFLMRRRSAEKRAELLTIRDGEEFTGFAYLICHADLAYLFFFAIVPEKRGKGFGTEALRLLKARYQGKRLFLAREQLDPDSDNYDERVKRHNFYLHAGFTDLPCKIREIGVTFDTMSTGCSISAADYNTLMRSYLGRFLYRLLPAELLE